MFSYLLHHLLVILILLCHSITTIRLIIYQRGFSNYHALISLLAWMLIVCTGTRAMYLLLHFNMVNVTPDQAGIALLLSILVWRAKGNVAKIVRGES